MSIHSSIQCSGDQIINSAQEENEPDLFFSCKSSLDLELVRVQIAEEGFNDIGEDEKTIKLKKFPPTKDNFVVDQCGCDWWFIGIALFLLAIFVMLIFFQLSCNCLQTVFDAQKLKLKLTTHYLREGFKKKGKKVLEFSIKGGGRLHLKK